MKFYFVVRQKHSLVGITTLEQVSMTQVLINTCELQTVKTDMTEDVEMLGRSISTFPSDATSLMTVDISV